MDISRRDFIKMFSALPTLPLLNINLDSILKKGKTLSLMNEWGNPPREYSQAPFWFWNDELSEKEIIRQLSDFRAHGIYGFVIHPRVGLPQSIGFLSERMLYFMRVAIEEAAKRKMWVVLYDEGMYPSGSASGQVVAENHLFRPNALFAIDLDNVQAGSNQFGFNIGSDGNLLLKENQKLLETVNRKKDGHKIAVAQRFVSDGYSIIRGLHYLDPNAERREDKKEVAEETPAAADILNPDAVNCFIRLVYQRFYDEFGKHFGRTVKAIFTDEPSFLGRKVEKGAIPGNEEILKFINKWSNKDITEGLPALWFDDEPNSQKIRSDYYRALNARLEETYYQPISQWCIEHNISLTGHPEKPDDIGHERYFQFPGQDIVWREIEPGNANAIEGRQSTQAKCASSAMIHLKRRRNSNEYCGAFGHNFTFKEMKWLANWLLIRGCNLLYPHAFYYSVRGPRIDERPPDVGPNNIWWNEFKPFADSVSRLCWLNTDSKHICEIAILGLNDSLSWHAAKVCFQNQYDFNYLEARHLWEDAKVDADGIHIAGMNYKILIIENDIPQKAEAPIQILQAANRIIKWNEKDREERLLNFINSKISKDVILSQSNKDIRIRHVLKNGNHFYLIFNEGETNIETEINLSVKGSCSLLDIETTKRRNVRLPYHLEIPAHALKVFMLD